MQTIGQIPTGGEGAHQQSAGAAASTFAGDHVAPPPLPPIFAAIRPRVQREIDRLAAAAVAASGEEASGRTSSASHQFLYLPFLNPPLNVTEIRGLGDALSSENSSGGSSRLQVLDLRGSLKATAGAGGADGGSGCDGERRAVAVATAAFLYRVLSQQQAIRDLMLGGNDLDANPATAIARALREAGAGGRRGGRSGGNPQAGIRKLWLDSNRIGDEGLAKLASFLECKSCQLEELELHRNGITSRGC